MIDWLTLAIFGRITRKLHMLAALPGWFAMLFDLWTGGSMYVAIYASVAAQALAWLAAVAVIAWAVSAMGWVR